MEVNNIHVYENISINSRQNKPNVFRLSYTNKEQRKISNKVKKKYTLCEGIDNYKTRIQSLHFKYRHLLQKIQCKYERKLRVLVTRNEELRVWRNSGSTRITSKCYVFNPMKTPYTKKVRPARRLKKDLRP